MLLQLVVAEQALGDELFIALITFDTGEEEVWKSEKDFVQDNLHLIHNSYLLTHWSSCFLAM